MAVSSAVAIQSALAVETDEIWLFLMHIVHPDLPDGEQYLVNDMTDLTIENYLVNPDDETGITVDFHAYPFMVTLSSDTGETLPQVKLEIDNVDQLLVEMIRTVSSSPSVEIRLVLKSQPNITEFAITDLVLREVTYDAYKISGTLYADDILNSRYPAHSITVAGGYPGMFK